MENSSCERYVVRKNISRAKIAHVLSKIGMKISANNHFFPVSSGKFDNSVWSNARKVPARDRGESKISKLGGIRQNTVLRFLKEGWMRRRFEIRKLLYKKNIGLGSVSRCGSLWVLRE